MPFGPGGGGTRVDRQPRNPATILTRTRYAQALHRCGDTDAAIAELEAALEHATPANTNERWRRDIPLLLRQWRSSRRLQRGDADADGDPPGETDDEEPGGFELFD